MYETILVATDSSDEADAAMTHAIDLAAQLGATVHVVTVLDTTGNPYRFSVDEANEMNAAARELVEDVAVAHDGSEATIETEILRGEPASTILAYADEIEADLVVVGQRGTSGLTGTLIGSTTDRLARLTDRPLTIIPATE